MLDPLGTAHRVAVALAATRLAPSCILGWNPPVARGPSLPRLNVRNDPPSVTATSPPFGGNASPRTVWFAGRSSRMTALSVSFPSGDRFQTIADRSAAPVATVFP